MQNASAVVSRNHGCIERKLLDILDASDTLRDTFELAAEALELKPDHSGRIEISPAQSSSVRRALQKLACEGRIVAAQMLSSYSEGALKNHQQLQRTAGAAPFAFQASDKGGLHGNAPLTLPHKSLGLG